MCLLSVNSSLEISEVGWYRHLNDCIVSLSQWASNCFLPSFRGFKIRGFITFLSVQDPFLNLLVSSEVFQYKDKYVISQLSLP